MPELPPPPSPDSGDADVRPAATVLDALRQLTTAAGAARTGYAGLGRLAGGVAALLVVVAIAWAAFVRGSTAAPPPELTMPTAGATTSSGPGAGSRSTDPPTSMTAVYVHVAGAVAHPGLYRLGGTPRVADAIDVAGGVAPNADLDAVNLAAAVADGERIYVPRVGEPAPPTLASGTAAAAAAGPIDLNTATVEQLDALPGVGPSTAQAIVDYRQEHGRFRSVDELLEVRGIGPSKLDDLRTKVRVR